MTTYRYTGFKEANFAATTLSVQTGEAAPTLTYSVNWREPDGLFNSSFVSDAYDILLGSKSILASTPYVDVQFLQYDWASQAEHSYFLRVHDQITGGTHYFQLGGLAVALPTNAAEWAALTGDISAITNPLPGTGFAAGTALALGAIPTAVISDDDVILGTPGADDIDGGTGNDTIKGLDGDDTLLGGDGADLLRGNGGADSLDGGLGDDRLFGGIGEDTLTGGEGVDALTGGQDGDIYFEVGTGDTIHEQAGHMGRDRVEATISFSLIGTRVEDLTLLDGFGDLNATGSGSANIIRGNDGANIINGKKGADTMLGGLGDDIYYVDNAGDHVGEGAGRGLDVVRTAMSYALSAHVENLGLKGTGDINGTGNGLSNLIGGTSGNNRLDGRGGNDVLRGGDGDDTLRGGDGRDTMIGGDGSDTYVVGEDGRTDTVREIATHSGTDQVFSFVSVNYRAEHVENVTLKGTASRDVHANDLGNIIRGNTGYNELYAYGGDDTILAGAGNDTLNGGTGADHMVGGAGNDTYYVDNAGDRVVEQAGGGTDTLITTFSTNLAATLEHLTLKGSAAVGNGNGGGNRIYGNDEDNLLQGLAGNDTIYGQGGNDLIRGGDGRDRLYGDNGNDTIQGGDGNDNIYGGNGNNVMNGGTGADNMSGNNGNDIAFFDHDGDYFWGGGGYDIIHTSVSVNGGDHAYIEEIRALGSGDIDIGADTYMQTTLRGNAGNNRLTGGNRADTMLGGLGDDIYDVNDKRDIVIEGAGAGDDMVVSTVSYALTAHVERLKFAGNGAINGFGNGLDNIILGNGGNNTLAGRDGSDTITGGAGEDTFVFDRALGPDNVDHITDFSNAADTMILRASVFTGLTAGALATGALRGGVAAQDADDRIIYNRATGELFFDEDGTGAGAQVLFAVLDNMTAINASDFVVV